DNTERCGRLDRSLKGAITLSSKEEYSLFRHYGQIYVAISIEVRCLHIVGKKGSRTVGGRTRERSIPSSQEDENGGVHRALGIRDGNIQVAVVIEIARSQASCNPRYVFDEVGLKRPASFTYERVKRRKGVRTVQCKQRQIRFAVIVEVPADHILHVERYVQGVDRAAKCPIAVAQHD